MTINTKTIPQFLKEFVDSKTLLLLLKQEDEEYGSFEHTVIYKNFAVDLENTWEVHKTRGHIWKVVRVGIIQIGKDGNLLTDKIWP